VIGTTELHHRIDGAGPDLVLLHGGGGSTEDLAALRSRLVGSHRVISPDQRGHGRTPFAEPLTYAAMAADTAALLDGLGVRGADLVGWSDGGVVALMVARDRPDLAGHVVALGANVDAGPAEPHHLSPEKAAEQRSLTPGLLGVDPHMGAALVALWTSPHGISLADLRSSRSPVLFLAGDRDLITHDHTIAMFRAAPEARLAILPDAGHEAPITHADLVALLVERFLAA
jgi:pimeloyl-ACP methyl ester carboxylesterase